MAQGGEGYKTADEGGFIAMGTRLPVGKGADLVSWGGGTEETYYYVAVLVFQIVCDMEMSLMETLTWRGLVVTSL